MRRTRGYRLRAARKKHFGSARAAAKALGVPVSTYAAHERAEAVAGRDYGPNEAKRYAHRFGVSPEWLLTGFREKSYSTSAASKQANSATTSVRIPIVGYIGRNAESHYYDVPREFLKTVEISIEPSESTVAVEIRGDSFGHVFNHWLIFYDDVRRQPVDADLIGKLCVVALKTGRIVFKRLHQSKSKGRFDLFSEKSPPERAVQVKWAAQIKKIVQPPASLKRTLKRHPRPVHRRRQRR